MRKNQLHNLPSLKERRKELRSNLTRAETILWKHLQNSKLERRKFRRQHSVGSYILDFYCPVERLAIEMDGGQHLYDENIEYDIKRTHYLKEMKIKTIRFLNGEVYNNIDGVLDAIKKEFKTPPPTPS